MTDAPFALIHAEVQLGDNVVLQDVSLELARGVTTVLIGPSGGGKSTLLRALMGLVPLSRGQVLFEGAPVTRETSLQLRQRMGYVLQGGGLFPHLTARANVTLLARHLGWPRRRLDARVSELGALVQLPASLLEQRPGQHCGGQRQRVALMRALMLDPEVLLLDEPLGALDPITRLELQEELRALFHRLERTVILVTHDLGEAAFLGQQLVLLRDGAVLQQGPAEAFIHRPATDYVRRFIEAQRGPLRAAEGGA